MELYLIRHGETNWNREGRLQGRRDIPMNDNGIAQAGYIGSCLRDMGLCADAEGLTDFIIVSSPLMRAKVCAEIIADQLGYAKEKILTEPLLIERSFGRSEGEIWQPDMREHEQENQWENMETLVARARSGIEKYLTCKEQRVVVVAHGAILKAVLAVLSNESIEHGDNSNAVKQGSVVVVEYEQGGLKNVSEVSVSGEASLEFK